jgi:hypothetical protein
VSGKNIRVSVKDIYAVLCPECQEKVKAMLRNKVASEIVDKVVS